MLGNYSLLLVFGVCRMWEHLFFPIIVCIVFTVVLCVVIFEVAISVGPQRFVGVHTLIGGFNSSLGKEGGYAIRLGL